MTITFNRQADNTTIYLGDKFDFSEIDSFKETYEGNPSKSYKVDFGKTNYMDSSGLGMLISMKRTAGESSIDLVNCKAQIKKVLVVSRFDEHFNIS